MHNTLKQRSMTFTGCWTCKRRKVKCDERPSQCGNCEKASISCEGYGIRLQWVSDPLSQADLPKGQAKGRIRIDPIFGPHYRLDEIDNFLIAIDNDAITQRPTRKGPFTIFPIHNAGCIDGGVSTTLVERSGAIDGLSHSNALSNDDGAAAVVDSEYYEMPTSPMYNPPLPPNGQGPRDTSLETDDVEYDPSDSSIGALRVTNKIQAKQYDLPHNVDDIEETSQLESASPLFSRRQLKTVGSGSFVADSLSTHHVSTSLSGDSMVDMLMHHYIVNVADLLQPVRHPQNPYRNYYAPAALEVAAGLVPQSQIWNLKVHSVLYHSLLASAAFHLACCNPGNGAYFHIGASHRQQALDLLQSAIDPSTPVAAYKSLLMAMLSLVTVSAMSDGGTDFFIHLQGSKQLRKSRQKWRLVSGATQQLNEISVFLSLLARTTSFQSSHIPWADEDAQYLDAEVEMSFQPGCCFEYMYGTTPTITALLGETCRLAEYLSYYELNQEPIPGSLLQVCESLGDRLLSWSLDYEPVTSIPADDPEMRTIFTHHANAWHTAALIYYYRRIQGYGSEDLEQEVSRVAARMHAVEDVKAHSGSDKASRMAPITWPAFIASCEARDRQAWVEWWSRAQKYGIANITRQWDVVQQIWKRKDEAEEAGLGPCSWIDIFRDCEYKLLAI